MIDLKSLILAKKMFGGGSSGGVTTKEVDILTEQTLGFKSDSSLGGVYSTSLVESAGQTVFELIDGEKYIVEWDGEKYQCTASPFSMEGLSGFAIGNWGIVGEENTGEPFVIGYIPVHPVANTKVNLIVSSDTEASHKIRIYQVEEATALFPQSKSVNLAMAEGNQTITPDEGYVLSEVTVNKPDTLIPENIAEGIDIGGVIGSLVAGGNNMRIASGKTESYGVYSFQHNLGVVPDVIIFFGPSLSGNYLRTAFGISSKLNSLININNYMQSYTYVKSGATTTSFDKACITLTSGFIRNANETSFDLNSNIASTASNMYWIAIGGLTE